MTNNAKTISVCRRRTLLIAQLLLTLIILFIGYRHLVNPAPFIQLLPYGFPLPSFSVWISGVAELVLGIWWWLPRRYYGHWGALLVFLMLLVYLPLHIIDAFRTDPVIASKVAADVKMWVAWGRIALQGVFLYATWQIFRHK